MTAATGLVGFMLTMALLTLLAAFSILMKLRRLTTILIALHRRQHTDAHNASYTGGRHVR